MLYAYEAKIIATWTLPKGWVSYLVIGYGIVGILSILLVYPIRHTEGNKWISIFSKWFYLAIFPLVILLLVAIGTRVQEYGITENRYFILVISCWLAFIAAFFLVTKRQNIKVIPISLSLIFIFACWGPQSAFHISEWNQRQRLVHLLEKNAILVDGKIKRTSSQIPVEDEKEISGIVDYLKESHGVASLQPLYTEDLSAIYFPPYSGADTLVNLMGLNYVPDWSNQSEYLRTYYFSTSENLAIKIENYDYAFALNPTYDGLQVTVEADVFTVSSLEDTKGLLKIKISNGEELEFDILKLAAKLRSIPKTSLDNSNTPSQIVPVEELTLQDSTAHFTSTLIIKTLNFDNKQGTEPNTHIYACDGLLLIRKKK